MHIELRKRSPSILSSRLDQSGQLATTVQDLLRQGLQRLESEFGTLCRKAFRYDRTARHTVSRSNRKG